jgi:NAD(P)H-flavin reductase
VEIIGGKRETLLCKDRVKDNIYLLQFSFTPVVLAGQFFMIKKEHSSVFLARPISVFNYQNNVVSFLIDGRGEGTEEIISMNVGDSAELIGPLGNSFDDFLPKSPCKIALVAGGVGIAPLLFFLNSNCNGEFDFYAGFKNGAKNIKKMFDVLACKNNLVVACEDESFEDGALNVVKGRITDFFDPQKYSAVFTCGPFLMMEKVAALCRAKNVPCIVSMEKKMACGVGACLGCSIKTKSGNKRCCADGPVFDAKDIFYE